jgi:hypothetical protein
MNDEREQSTRPADDGEPVQPVHPYGASGLAAYRWLLRRLFDGDMTPPPAEDRVEDSSRALDLRGRIIQTYEPPTEPDEGE